MSVETVTAARWLYSVLASDRQLDALVSGRIFAYRVPDRANFPAVVFAMQSAQPDIGVRTDRVGSRLRYVVKAVTVGDDFAAIRSIAERIDAVLQAASGQVSDGVVAICHRESPIEILERTDLAQDYAHLGGLYRLLVQGSE